MGLNRGGKGLDVGMWSCGERLVVGLSRVVRVVVGLGVVCKIVSY